MPKPDDSSLPIHIGQTVVNGMMDLKEEVGKLNGKVDGVIVTISELRAHQNTLMTREECARIQSQRRWKPSSEVRKERSEWWANTRNKVAVVAGLIVIACTMGGAFYWMSSAYNVIQKARVEIKAASDAGVKP